jgi:hypothetical protein
VDTHTSRRPCSSIARGVHQHTCRNLQLRISRSTHTDLIFLHGFYELLKLKVHGTHFALKLHSKTVLGSTMGSKVSIQAATKDDTSTLIEISSRSDKDASANGNSAPAADAAAAPAHQGPTTFERCLAFFGLRHAETPLWRLKKNAWWHMVFVFGFFLWTIVCFGGSGLGVFSALMPLNQGLLSSFSKLLIGSHNAVPLLVYGCLMRIFYKNSEPPVFKEEVCDGGDPPQSPESPLKGDADFDDNVNVQDNVAPSENRATLFTFIGNLFTFIGLCWVLFLGSWAYFGYWVFKEAYDPNSPYTPGPSKIFYYIIVGTYFFRVWPVILATRMIVVSFEKFEEVAKQLYRYHRQKPPVHVVVGVVPTHYLKDIGKSPLTTHDLFFMENLHECRSVKYEMCECDGVLNLKVTLVENENGGWFPFLDEGLCLKVEDLDQNKKTKPKRKILPLCDNWTPFIGVRVPGTTVRISEARTRPIVSTTTSHYGWLHRRLGIGIHTNWSVSDYPITEKTSLRSAYEVAGFKKQDQGSCFPYDLKNGILQKGSADFHETAILLRSPGPGEPPDHGFWAWTHAKDPRKRELCQHKYFLH